MGNLLYLRILVILILCGTPSRVLAQEVLWYCCISLVASSLHYMYKTPVEKSEFWVFMKPESDIPCTSNVYSTIHVQGGLPK